MAAIRTLNLCQRPFKTSSEGSKFISFFEEKNLNPPIEKTTILAYQKPRGKGAATCRLPQSLGGRGRGDGTSPDLISGLNGGSTVFFFQTFFNTVSIRKSGLHLTAGVKLKFWICESGTCAQGMRD